MIATYAPMFLLLAIAGVLAATFWGAATFLGRHKHPSLAKNAPFECGSEPIGTPRGRYSVKFYQVAILFLVFDIEAAFMYPWSILYTALSKGPTGAGSIFGFAEMLVFVAILVVALVYVWRKKAIGWE